MDDITKGIIIGAGGALLGGFALSFIAPVKTFIIDIFETRKIYNWIRSNSSDKSINKFISTRLIASHCNLTEERVRELCSKSKRIYLSTGSKDDRWSIRSRHPSGFFTRNINE